jgi:MFS family permease
VLHEGPAAVSLLAAAGLVVGAAVALPLGPWAERRHKRPVMIAMDVLRCVALVSVPLAYVLGWLGFGQLVAVAVVVAAAKIAFNAAAGAHLRDLVGPDRLLRASSRFESTTWSAMVVGPPLGGAAVGLLGPVVTVLADAVSYLLSAVGLLGVRAPEPPPVPRRRGGVAEVLEGWRHILGHPVLRRLFWNVVLVNGLIMATEPVIAVLMLGRLGFAPWQYGLAFAVPCVGGFVASRVAPGLVDRFGQQRVLRTTGVVRACWSVGLAAVVPGVVGLTVVVVVQFGLVISCGLFNPTLAVRRLELTPPALTARTLTAWSISTSGGIAALTAVWGVLAEFVGPRAAIALAGAGLLLTPLLLPGRAQGPLQGVHTAPPRHQQREDDDHAERDGDDRPDRVRR